MRLAHASRRDQRGIPRVFRHQILHAIDRGPDVPAAESMFRIPIRAIHAVCRDPSTNDTPAAARARWAARTGDGPPTAIGLPNLEQRQPPYPVGSSGPVC